MSLSFNIVGRAERIGPDRLIALAAEFAVEPAMIDAIIRVEVEGKAWDPAGRMNILPEKHVLYRVLPAELKSKAIKAGVACKGWSYDNYKGLGRDGTNAAGEARWGMIERAADAVGEQYALQMASYGLCQFLGENYRIAGYATPQAMVQAFADSEEAQVRAFLVYLVKRNLIDEMQRRDWRGLSRGWNGPAYETHDYHGRLERAYHASKLPKGAAKSLPDWHDDGTLRIGARGDAVLVLQRKLNRLNLGLSVTEDGDFGDLMRTAVIAFQAAHGLVTDGIVGPETRAMIEAAAPRPERSLTMAAIIEQSPAAQAKIGGILLSAATTAAGVANSVTTPASTGTQALPQVAKVDSEKIVATIEQAAKITAPLETTTAFATKHPMIVIGLVALIVSVWGLNRIAVAIRTRNATKL